MIALHTALGSEWFLLLGFLALCAGPLMVWALRAHVASTVALDSFCLITISGFALLHLLPESAEQAGWLVLPLALVGFVLPSIAERTLHHGHRGVRRTAVLLAVFGIAAHATLDGLFLEAGGHLHDGHGHDQHATHELTAWAVILHRIPEGLGIWWIVPRTLGLRAAVLQSLLVGSLLHVVLHAHIPAPKNERLLKPASVFGAALGALVLWFVIHDHFPAGEYGGPAQVFVRLAIESAPALLLAYLLVGLSHAFLPSNWLRTMTRGPKLLQAVRGVAVGLPLPVCSCGVVPIYRELIRQGAAVAAAVAFLIATPELELAAVTLTFQLMGGEIALVRVAMAAVLALVVGVLVASFAQSRTAPTSEAPSKANAEANARSDGDAEAETEADCCSGPEPPAAGFGQRLLQALRFGFGPAVDSTATWILTGLLLSAMLMPYVDREWIASLPTWIDVPVAALLGLPLYVCATGSTPLAAMLLVQGLSPGAVLALLLTGPATNVTTFGVLARLHGKRFALVFALAMWCGAIALGYLANLVIDVRQVPAFDAHDHASTTAWIWLWALAALFFWSLLRQGVRPFLERLFESPANTSESSDHDHGHGHDSCEHEPPPARDCCSH